MLTELALMEAKRNELARDIAALRRLARVRRWSRTCASPERDDHDYS